MSVAVAEPGPIVNDIQGMGSTHELLGGTGSCRWKQLINGMHLTGPWNCVEYVVVPPGSSCGKHAHLRTEEIYYILSGRAEMELDGELIELSSGDLVTATIGASHGTVNRGGENMEFLVIEVFPGRGPAPASVRIPLGEVGISQLGTDDGPVAWQRSLALEHQFTGPWRRFARIEIPPGGELIADPVPDADEVLFVTHGSAIIRVGELAADGERGLCVGVPPGTGRAIVNASGDEHLEVASAIVGVG